MAEGVQHHPELPRRQGCRHPLRNEAAGGKVAAQQLVILQRIGKAVRSVLVGGFFIGRNDAVFFARRAQEVADAADHDAVDTHLLFAAGRVHEDLGRGQRAFVVEEGLVVVEFALGRELEVQRRLAHQAGGEQHEDRQRHLPGALVRSSRQAQEQHQEAQGDVQHGHREDAFLNPQPAEQKKAGQQRTGDVAEGVDRIDSPDRGAGFALRTHNSAFIMMNSWLLHARCGLCADSGKA